MFSAKCKPILEQWRMLAAVYANVNTANTKQYCHIFANHVLYVWPVIILSESFQTGLSLLDREWFKRCSSLPGHLSPHWLQFEPNLSCHLPCHCRLPLVKHWKPQLDLQGLVRFPQAEPSPIWAPP